jgi:hypothetical protein
MKEVFISYSSIDTAPAETVRNILESNGISCWMAPRDIAGGSNYTREIPIAIRNCKIFLLILSENAQNSPWVLKELDSAVNGAKVILPFMLEECILNDEFNFLLSGAQRYSAYQKKAETMEKLIGRIQAILSADGEKPAQEIPPEPAPEVTPPPAPTPTPVADIFGQIVCPACGSADVKELPKKIKRQGAFEWLMLAVPVLFAILGSLVASIPIGLLYWYSSDGGLLLVWLLFVVAGGCCGHLLERRIIRRHRLRNRKAITCYRCNRCDKRFNDSRPLDQ